MAELAESAFATDSIGIAWADVLTTTATTSSNAVKRRITAIGTWKVCAASFGRARRVDSPRRLVTLS
jgi:hypothetical protein